MGTQCGHAAQTWSRPDCPVTLDPFVEFPCCLHAYIPVAELCWAVLGFEGVLAFLKLEYKAKLEYCPEAVLK